MLRSSRYFDVGNSGIVQQVLQRLSQSSDRRFSLATPLRYELRERLVFLDLEMLECEILELPPHARHAESMGKRRIQVARLLCDARSLLDRQVLERPHVVQAVRKLDDDDARIFRNRKKELAIILDLPVLRGIDRQMPDLGQAIDDLRDLSSEMRFDFGH